MSIAPTPGGHVATGNTQLDLILRGGLPKGMVYLVHGGPGTGKTTLAMEFLLEGVRRGERVFYASLLQTRDELETVMRSHHWSLDGIDLLELPERCRRASTDEQTLFTASEVELHEVADAIMQSIASRRPQRLVFDSVTQLAMLVDSQYQLRRHMLKLKDSLSEIGCTTILTLHDTEAIDLHGIQTLVHGMIKTAARPCDYGPPQRWIEVSKMRGMTYIEGPHDFRIRTGGLEIYPRLEVTATERQTQWKVVSSGNAELDALFGGGIEEGTACLISGTTGAGKSTLASIYAEAAARRGDRSLIFCFDERSQTFLRRSESLGIGIAQYIDQGLIDMRQINLGDITPGELAHNIRRAADEEHVKLVVIDSINGYLNVMIDHRQLVVQLHEMLSYLSGAGVSTLMIMASHGVATVHPADLDASYIADTVVSMRSFEARGVIRRCIAVLKKRHGDHEKTIREFVLNKNGIQVGPPLREFQGVLTGEPVYVGKATSLMDTEQKK